jgi:hypothetical protein
VVVPEATAGPNGSWLRKALILQAAAEREQMDDEDKAYMEQVGVYFIALARQLSVKLLSPNVYLRLWFLFDLQRRGIDGVDAAALSPYDYAVDRFARSCAGYCVAT